MISSWSSSVNEEMCESPHPIPAFSNPVEDKYLEKLVAHLGVSNLHSFQEFNKCP